MVTALKTEGSVTYVPNLFGEESLLIVGGGKYKYDDNTVEELSDKIVSFKIKRTTNANKPLEFENKAEKSWLGNLPPYVEVLEDKVVIAQAGYYYVRYL